MNKIINENYKISKYDVIMKKFEKLESTISGIILDNNLLASMSCKEKGLVITYLHTFIKKYLLGED
jgi:hypothetical protein